MEVCEKEPAEVVRIIFSSSVLSDPEGAFAPPIAAVSAGDRQPEAQEAFSPALHR